METVKVCSNCGARLAPDAPRGICPECLLKAGLGSESAPDATVAVANTTARRELPKAGERFGGYLIARELGRGGMGAVYEAEQLESGRRVALKVLGHKLDSPEARKRFLREGRLAASINHPNSVYVYGTDEIDGTPVIAMELIAGGTLQHRVETGGPLPVADAVDAILHIIAGLEAAQALGILHRDIKPSNCFQEADGAVKIGDFGLSISTAARGDSNVTVQGALLGTPAFASPEQLRGEELNARSDMYSVGVTLFYLLSGHTPFEAPNMVQLIANVLEQPAPSPRKFRAVLPPELAKLVLRCLEKQPGERFKTYDELRQALAPFSSTVPLPAPLGVRFVAGALDMFFVGLAGMAFSLLVFGDLLPFASAGVWASPKMFGLVAAAFCLVILYYTLLEGIWGASLGKALCRLRVTGPERNPPGLAKALGRALIFQILPALPYWVSFGFDPTQFLSQSSTTMQYFVSSLYYAVVVLLFCSARRRNGFAGVHDLLTRTRVIRKTAFQARPVLQATEECPPAAETKPMVGPYHVLESLEKTPTGEWLVGYDTRLLRRVWIRTTPPGTPPITPGLRNLGRAGRLRWLAGRRTPEENWDAFEGVTGKPLLSLLQGPQPWSRVRFWMLDLAREISAAEKDGTLPATLNLDRVWVTGDGRAKLLDFPAPGLVNAARPGETTTTLDAPPKLESSRSASEFLSQVARAALEGRVPAASVSIPGALAAPLPLHAREFLGTLRGLASAGAIVDALQPLLHQIATVSRLRRLGLVAACAVLPVIAGCSLLFGMKWVGHLESRQPGVWELTQLLQVRSGLQMPWARQRGAPDDRAFAIYIASHHRQTITNATLWSSMYALSMIQGENRQFAQRSLADHPNPSEEEIQQATEALKPMLAGLQAASFSKQPWFPLVALGMSWIFYVGLPALVAALLFRGGLVLRALRVAVVRRDGSPASRLRVFWRSVVTWLPVLLAPVLIMLLQSSLGVAWAAGLSVGLVGSLALWSVTLPERSLQDRIAGTCLVPR